MEQPTETNPPIESAQVPTERRAVLSDALKDILGQPPEVKEVTLTPEQRRTVMAEMIKTKLKNEGPFTHYREDKPLMEALLAWIGTDWMRLRELLNYVYDQGEICALNYTIGDVAKYIKSIEGRNDPTWGADSANTLPDFIAGTGPRDRNQYPE